MTDLHDKTILVADDDQDFCELLTRTLSETGFSVIVAFDGKEALDLYRMHAPDLVILDSMLPEKPGLECLRELRSLPNQKPAQVLMCSGKGDMDYVLECSEAGANGFLHKPCDLNDLLQRVRRALQAF